MSTLVTSAEEKTTVYDFGDLPIAFASVDDHWLELLERRYRSFRSVVPASRTFRLSFAPDGPLPEEVPSALAAHLEAVELEPTPSGFRARTRTSIAEVDLDAGEGWLRGPSAMYPLDNLLVQLLPLITESSLLFHAAALAPGGAGLLVPGASGAGKSTLASLAGAEALCDEVAAVRLEPREFRLVALPFWMGRPGSAPLAAVALLAQAAEHALTPLAPGEALRRLSQLVLWPTASPAAMGRCLSHLAALVESLPVYELQFAPRPDVLAFLREELS